MLGLAKMLVDTNRKAKFIINDSSDNSNEEVDLETVRTVQDLGFDITGMSQKSEDESTVTYTITTQAEFSKTDGEVAKLMLADTDVKFVLADFTCEVLDAKLLSALNKGGVTMFNTEGSVIAEVDDEQEPAEANEPSELDDDFDKLLGKEREKAEEFTTEDKEMVEEPEEPTTTTEELLQDIEESVNAKEVLVEVHHSIPDSLKELAESSDTSTEEHTETQKSGSTEVKTSDKGINKETSAQEKESRTEVIRGNRKRGRNKIYDSELDDKELLMKGTPSNGGSKITPLILRACNEDFTYFVGEGFTINLDSSLASNFSEKDKVLEMLDKKYVFQNSLGENVSLLAVCQNTMRNIRVYPAFSPELTPDEGSTHLL